MINIVVNGDFMEANDYTDGYKHGDAKIEITVFYSD